MADERHLEFEKFRLFVKLKIVTLCHIENRFWLYLGAILADSCRYRSLDQNGNFRKFKMADGRHFQQISLSLYLSRNYPITIKFGVPMQIYNPRMAI